MVCYVTNLTRKLDNNAPLIELSFAHRQLDVCSNAMVEQTQGKLARIRWPARDIHEYSVFSNEGNDFALL